jgi:16S rRNA (cytosine967-C5)-methyltransferase
LPVRLFNGISGRQVVDLCAAPGGKTAQLASAGAQVTAVDRSSRRLDRLVTNLNRLGMQVAAVAADALIWRPEEPVDAVLLDAPCSSTGTIRRHPDVAWLKREADLTALADLQRRLLDRAVALVKPGGLLVYCTCSLEPEESEAQVEALLARAPWVRRRPLRAGEIDAIGEFISPAGDLRTLPCQWPDPDPRMAGLDGFYAARLERT